MSSSVLASLNIHDRFRVKELRDIKEYSSSTEKASALFDAIKTQLASCNSQNCEPETIYKNAMAIGDFWGLGAEDFKRRVAESKLEEDSDNWFFRAFVGGAKFARNAKDTRTAEEKAADLEKLKQLAGIKARDEEKPKIRRIKGTVKWFDEERGIGCIESEDGRAVYVKRSAILGDGGMQLITNKQVSIELFDTQPQDFQAAAWMLKDKE